MRMLARLILTLLLAAFAVPAAAASGCHEATVAPMTHHGLPGDHHRAPDPAIGVHSCIGCIPPGNWLGVRIAARLPRPVMPLAIVQQAFAAGIAAPPALPPPRIA